MKLNADAKSLQTVSGINKNIMSKVDEIEEAIQELQKRKFWIGFIAGFLTAIALVCIISWYIISWI